MIFSIGVPLIILEVIWIECKNIPTVATLMILSVIKILRITPFPSKPILIPQAKEESVCR